MFMRWVVMFCCVSYVSVCLLRMMVVVEVVLVVIVECLNVFIVCYGFVVGLLVCGLIRWWWGRLLCI